MRNILKVKDWIKSKEQQFTVQQTVVGIFTKVTRIKDNKRFFRSQNLQFYGFYSAIINDFHQDVIHVTLEFQSILVGQKAIYKSCSINDLEAVITETLHELHYGDIKTMK